MNRWSALTNWRDHTYRGLIGIRANLMLPIKGFPTPTRSTTSPPFVWNPRSRVAAKDWLLSNWALLDLNHDSGHLSKNPFQMKSVDIEVFFRMNCYCFYLTAYLNWTIVTANKKLEVLIFTEATKTLIYKLITNFGSFVKWWRRQEQGCERPAYLKLSININQSPITWL